jgi:hypothetical protein
VLGRQLFMVRAVILWVHVLCGVAWIGVCASFVVAAAALGGEPGELNALTLRAAPRINRLSLPVATLIPLTGMGNLIFVARTRDFILPSEFVGILSAKILLYAVMALALWRAWGLEATIARSLPKSQMVAMVDVRKLMMLYGLIIGAGTLALALGLWLSGV